MLGQPVYFLTPDVVGVQLKGRLGEGVTATDLVLVLTEMLRKAKVVGKFVEFFGEGAASLPVTDRATVANMAPEYGATMGFFPIDGRSCDYLLATGRTSDQVATFRAYFEAQNLFGMPAEGELDYSETLELDLATVRPSVSGPKRPQDRIDLPDLKTRFRELFSRPVSDNGYGKDLAGFDRRFSARLGRVRPGGGSQAAPSIQRLETRGHESVDRGRDGQQSPHAERRLARGPAGGLGGRRARRRSHRGDHLLHEHVEPERDGRRGPARSQAVERGLAVSPRVKASLAPGSRVVTEYLSKTGLQPYLDHLGFNLVGYGCTTCIGNSGPLDAGIEETVTSHDLVTAAVLSGNRNFEARIHQSIKANFLMSPPLVVAFALAGKADVDLTSEPLGSDKEGKPVYLRDIWPSPTDVQEALPLLRRSGDIPPPVLESLRGESALEGDPRCDGSGLRMGSLLDVHSGAPVLRGLLAHPGARSGSPRRSPSRHLR
jgi:aconitate hydratase